MTAGGAVADAGAAEVGVDGLAVGTVGAVVDVVPGRVPAAGVPVGVPAVGFAAGIVPVTGALGGGCCLATGGCAHAVADTMATNIDAVADTTNADVRLFSTMSAL